jgi:NADP-dependent 3-hydroxy acid dehydrogenase YdfG
MNRSKLQRVVVITGASAGLGRAIARAFARAEGARIGLIARGKEGLEKHQTRYRKAGW